MVRCQTSEKERERDRERCICQMQMQRPMVRRAEGAITNVKICVGTSFLPCGNNSTMIEIIIAVFGAVDWPICHVPEAAAEDAADASEEAEDAAVSDGCDMRAFAPTTRRVGCPRFETGGVAAAETTCELAWRSIGCVGMQASSGDSTHSLRKGPWR